TARRGQGDAPLDEPREQVRLAVGVLVLHELLRFSTACAGTQLRRQRAWHAAARRPAAYSQHAGPDGYPVGYPRRAGEGPAHRAEQGPAATSEVRGPVLRNEEDGYPEGYPGGRSRRCCLDRWHASSAEKGPDRSTRTHAASGSR